MKKIIIFIGVAIIIGIGIYYAASNNSSVRNTSSLPAAQTGTAPTSADTTPAASNITVNIKNFSFNPRALTIKAGAKVTWINNDSVSHTVTSDSGSLLNSKTLSPGESFSATFTNPGSANYHCNIHPAMKGSLVIENQI